MRILVIFFLVQSIFAMVMSVLVYEGVINSKESHLFYFAASAIFLGASSFFNYMGV